MFSFLRWSSAKLRCPALPFVTGAEVGPEGTVGAWMLLILRGRPMLVPLAVFSCSQGGEPASIVDVEDEDARNISVTHFEARLEGPVRGGGVGRPPANH